MCEFVFDIEGNGLLPTITKVHSLVLHDRKTGEKHSLHGDSIVRGLEMMMKADLLVGHNVINFDLPALQKVYPWFTYDESKVVDTLIVSRVIWPNVADTDLIKIRKNRTTLPYSLVGSHSLEAWGHRLGNWKGDYAKVMEERGLDPWASWNPEMQTYCEQDVEVTNGLYDLIVGKNYSTRCLELEHALAFIMARMERHGFGFDTEAAEKLYVELAMKRADLEDKLRSIFNPWYVRDGDEFTPKRPNAKLGYWGHYRDPSDKSTFVGYPAQKIKLMVFNPNSNDQIEDRLRTIYGWKPREFTPTGKAKITDEILAELPYPEAKEISEYLMIQKRIGQLAEGDKAWLKFVTPEGRIHGRVVTNGAVTGRATHSNPNIAQVPSCDAPYGHECRRLFRARKGYFQLGCDVSGLELRMLGHFIARYDGGAYAREVIDGDIHTVNQEAAGLATRALAKRFIYAFLYGAGDELIGALVGGGRKEGKAIKRRFFKKIPALKKLIDNVKEKASTGSIRGLDGRVLHVRSEHSALNLLLQSGGAIVCKQWIVEFDKLLREEGLHNQVHLMAWVHDELQMEIPEELVETDEDGKLVSKVGELCIKAIERAGEVLGIRVPLTGEYKIGRTWEDCH